MDSLIEDIRTIVKKIDTFCSFLVISDYEEVEKLRLPLKLECSSLILSVLGCYEALPVDTGKIYVEKQYWAHQMKRVQDAIDSSDVFFVTDVLLHETADRLIMVSELLGA